MFKKFIIRLFVLLILAGAGFSGFWFFKANQFKSQIEKIIQDNAFYVSSRSVNSYGFPLKQKIAIYDLTFTLPLDSLSSHKFTIKNLEIEAELFKNNFAVSKIGNVLYNEKSSEAGEVSFIAEPKINIDFLTDGFSIKYSDNGFKITSLATKNLIFSSGPAKFSINSRSSKSGEISANFDISIKDVSSINLTSLYRDGLEPEITSSLENGDLKILPNISNQVDDQDFNELVNDEAIDQLAKNDAKIEEDEKNTKDKIDNKLAQDKKTENREQVELSLPQNPSKKTDLTLDDVNAPSNDKAQLEEVNLSDAVDGNIGGLDESQYLANIANNKGNIVDQINSIASDVEISLNYKLVPNSSADSYKIDSDPTKIARIPVSFTKSLDITKFTIANSLYKIFLKGKMQNYFDDPKMSGSIEVEVDGKSNLVEYITSEAKNLTHNSTSDIVEGSDLMIQESVAKSDNLYNNFLIKISEKIRDVVNNRIQDQSKIIMTKESKLLEESSIEKGEVNQNKQDLDSDQEVTIDAQDNTSPVESDSNVDSVNNAVHSETEISDENNQMEDIAGDVVESDSNQNLEEMQKAQEDLAGDIIKFTISREKNLEYIINNISFRQIIEDL